MNLFNKKHFGLFTVILAVFVLFASNAFAFPYFDCALQDISGNYVFYEDNTFSDRSIIGFLYYSDEALAVRYYSGATTDSPEKDITIYLSMDPSQDHVELTGEKIINAHTMDDADIINYLHDLVYEFTARRSRVELLSAEQKVQSVSDDFAQFGGNVTVKYNIHVPIFNIESICRPDGVKLFSVLTTGVLDNSTDQSFASYKGIYELPKDIERNAVIKVNAANVPVIKDDYKISLTDEWTAYADNWWFLGDYAMLTVTKIEFLEGCENEILLAFYDRNLNYSRDFLFNLAPYHKETVNRLKTTFTNVFYDAKNGGVNREFRSFIETEDGYVCMHLVVFDNVYLKYKNYFDGILNSFISN